MHVTQGEISDSRRADFLVRLLHSQASQLSLHLSRVPMYNVKYYDYLVLVFWRQGHAETAKCRLPPGSL